MVSCVTIPVSFLPKRLPLLGLTIGYIIVIHYLGFTLTTFLFMAASMLLLSNGRNVAFILVLSLAVSVAGWALLTIIPCFALLGGGSELVALAAIRLGSGRRRFIGTRRRSTNSAARVHRLR